MPEWYFHPAADASLRRQKQRQTGLTRGQLLLLTASVSFSILRLTVRKLSVERTMKTQVVRIVELEKKLATTD
jgi:hypothetical protein